MSKIIVNRSQGNVISVLAKPVELHLVRMLVTTNLEGMVEWGTASNKMEFVNQSIKLKLAAERADEDGEFKFLEYKGKINCVRYLNSDDISLETFDYAQFWQMGKPLQITKQVISLYSPIDAMRGTG